MSLAFDKVICAVTATFRPRPSWREAYLDALAGAMTRRAVIAAEAGQVEAAMQLLLRVRDVAPGDLESLVRLGLLHQDAGRFDEALDCYRRARAIDPIVPAAHLHAGLAHLSRGELEKGWEEFEWRLRLPDFQHLRGFAKPLWRGEDPAGRSILIHNEPTPTDAIQMLRYAPLLARRGARVYVETVPELAPLVARMPGVAGVAVGADDVARVASTVDWRCPLLSLPHRFRTTMATIPSDVPYFSADASRVSAWRSRLAENSASRNVGLVWPGAVELGHLLDTLRRLPGKAFVSLQRGQPGEMVDWTGELRAFADLADLVAALDLVIGPSNPVTHLAAAMNKPVWFLLPHVPDWRWTSSNATTPWYPRARLFRQTSPGDWAGVVRAVADSLAKLQSAS